MSQRPSPKKNSPTIPPPPSPTLNDPNPLPEDQSPNPLPNENGNGGGPSDAPQVEEIAVEALIPEAQPEPVAATVILSRDQFWEFFSSGFMLAGNMAAVATPMRQPLTSLIRAPQLPTARPAADALYDLAERYEWMRWLIEEQSRTMQALIVIAAFGAMTGSSVGQELRAQRAAREAWERQQQPEAQPEGEQPQGDQIG